MLTTPFVSFSTDIFMNNIHIWIYAQIHNNSWMCFSRAKFAFSVVAKIMFSKYLYQGEKS